MYKFKSTKFWFTIAAAVVAVVAFYHLEQHTVTEYLALVGAVGGILGVYSAANVAVKKYTSPRNKDGGP